MTAGAAGIGIAVRRVRVTALIGLGKVPTGSGSNVSAAKIVESNVIGFVHRVL